ncbi:uncharacterized protein LOC113798384 [Dermatophagoides pteronyssinus]|uniref:uncharacterized protein LOC113798384 n=1 Tax=Dermatophagoides pteronyssinus TaxID=6956 RepID=UPI003F679553
MAASTSHKIGGQLYTTESMLLHLLSRLDQARQRTQQVRRKRFGRHEPISLATMRYELCTFDLWRSIIAECLASFLYVFLLCSTHLTWNGSNFIFNSNTQPNWLIISLCSGFTMATLIHCFGHISGGHINPAVTISFLITKRISPLRTILYILAHCTGAIAGAALLYGVTVTGNQMNSMGPLGITIGHDSLNVWQLVTVELLLTFVVVFTTYATMDSNRKSFGSDALSIGIAYLITSLTGLPASGASMNPARTLGPAFVMNRWQNHWVYWAGPISGAIIAAIIYEFIFDTSRRGISSTSINNYYQHQQQQHPHHQQQQQLTQYQQASYLHHHQRLAAGSGTMIGGGKSSFFQDHFDFDLERDSNVDDDYEDPELSATAAAVNNNSKLTTVSNHTKLFQTGNGGGGGCSASAASSGSSSGHSRSNHTQHSIVSVHGGNNGGSFESYRPMIGPFGAGSTSTNANTNNNVPQSTTTTTIPELSSQIYNEPTNYYQSTSDRSTNNNSGGSNNNNVNNQTSSSSSFFHSMHPTDRTNRTAGHFTMRSSGNGPTQQQTAQQQQLNRHLNYDPHQSIIGPKF